MSETKTPTFMSAETLVAKWTPSEMSVEAESFDEHGSLAFEVQKVESSS